MVVGRWQCIRVYVCRWRRCGGGQSGGDTERLGIATEHSGKPGTRPELNRNDNNQQKKHLVTTPLVYRFFFHYFRRQTYELRIESALLRVVETIIIILDAD